MLLKNSPWAAGVHSLSAVRPWGQGGRRLGGGRGVVEKEREREKERGEDGWKRVREMWKNRVGWIQRRMN